MVFVVGLGCPAGNAGVREIPGASGAGTTQSGTARQPASAPQSATTKDDLPLSINEIIGMLGQSGAGKMSQGDIAAQVFKRGINFTPDERAIERIRQAGAELFLMDTIQRVAENGPPPKLTVRTTDTDPDPDPDQETEQEARHRAKTELMARMPLIEQARYKALDFAADLPLPPTCPILS